MQYRRRERVATKSLAAIGIASGMVLGLAPGSGAASTSITATAAYEIAHAGILSTTAFCGTKKITLGVEDGYGINSWSQASFAAVRAPRRRSAPTSPRTSRPAVGACPP